MSKIGVSHTFAPADKGQPDLLVWAWDDGDHLQVELDFPASAGQVGLRLARMEAMRLRDVLNEQYGHPAALGKLIEAAENVLRLFDEAEQRPTPEAKQELGEAIGHLDSVLFALRGEKSDKQLRRMIRDALVPRELRPETNAEIEQLLDSPEMRGEGKAKG